MTILFHALIFLVSTSYVFLLLGAICAFIYFLFAPSRTQAYWNTLNASDPETDFMHESSEIRGY